MSAEGGATGLTLVILAAGRAKRYGSLKPLAPVGTHGEAAIDLVASDALAAGFETIVLVLAPASGSAIRYHVEHTWPDAVDVRFRPILLTVLIASFGLLPTALGFGKGAAPEQGLAIVTLGGLVWSGLLSTNLLPALYVYRREKQLQEVS